MLLTDSSDHLRVRPNEHLDRSPDALRLRELDRQLLDELQQKTPERAAYSEATGLTFQNEAFAEIVKNNYSAEELADLEDMLNKKETIAISTVDGYSVTIDNSDHPISFVAATEISDNTPNHGEMSSMLYLRDHIQTASVYMELNLNHPESYGAEGEEGKRLLMSALHLMSTPTQLDRFKAIIENGEASQEDWPHISLLFNDLEGEEPNGWRNKQDTFQMLAYLACDALERGFISADELSESHQAFLGSVAPLLRAVGFPKYESSGSWEEIAATRTSVMAVETALLDKISHLADENPELAYLCGGLDSKAISNMRMEGLREMGRRLPFESPDYPKDSVKYREADAALAYVLMYGIPEMLAKEEIPTGPRGEIMSIHDIEDLVLKELNTLIDPKTGAMRRYNGDSYQRVNFHTNEVQETIADIKQTVKTEAGGGEIDLDKKQRLRGELTPKGREAAWTHPLGQLSAWAARRSIISREKRRYDDAENYRSLGTCFLNHTLATITGENQWQAVLDANKRYIIQKAPAAKLPECYVTYETESGEIFVVPSPHTPLNWSSAMLKEAVGLLRVATMVQ